MNRYQPMYPFNQQFFGVMPVYSFVMGPVYQAGANWNFMYTFMPQSLWGAGPRYRNQKRLQYKQRPALMQKETNNQKQKGQEQLQKKIEDLEQKQVQNSKKPEKDEKLKERNQQKTESRQLEEQQEFHKETKEKLKSEHILRHEEKVTANETSAWKIPRGDEKKLLQTLILEEELLESLQNRHLEEELRSKQLLQKIHLEEELKAKRELQQRHLEEQLTAMQSLQKQQLEEALREKSLLQERQLEEELKAKETLQMRHLEEELRVKELLLNRKRVIRKHEVNKQTAKPHREHDLKERTANDQLKLNLQKYLKRSGYETLNVKQLKQLLTEEISQLKKEIQLEKAVKAHGIEGQKHNDVTKSVALKKSLGSHTKLCVMSEADFVKHLGYIIAPTPLRNQDHTVKNGIHVACVEIHEDLPHIAGVITNNACSTDSSSTSSFDNPDARDFKSAIIEDISISVVSGTNNTNCGTNDTNIDGSIINGKEQSYTQFDESSICKSLPIVAGSHNSSFSVISESSDKDANRFMIKYKGDTKLDEFGGISPIEHLYPNNSKSPPIKYESHCSSFSVISENNDGLVIDDKEQSSSQCDVFGKISTNVDSLPMSDKDQSHTKYDKSLRKDCIRCGRPFYVNELGEYLKSETCTYHWSTLHYLYKGKQGYTAQYTCCKGNKDSEGCIRSALHIWSDVINNP